MATAIDTTTSLSCRRGARFCPIAACRRVSFTLRFLVRLFSRSSRLVTRSSLSNKSNPCNFPFLFRPFLCLCPGLSVCGSPFRCCYHPNQHFNFLFFLLLFCFVFFFFAFSSCGQLQNSNALCAVHWRHAPMRALAQNGNVGSAAMRPTHINLGDENLRRVALSVLVDERSSALFSAVAHCWIPLTDSCV